MSRQAQPPRGGKEIRINVSVDAELHKKLKATLALEGKTIRQWVSEQAHATVENWRQNDESKARA
jgi:predicted HicB family RNase H-like nuclease